MFRVNSRKRPSLKSNWSGGVVSNSALPPFFRRYTTFIVQFRWPIIVLWLILTGYSVFLLPKLDVAVQHARINYLPTDSPMVQGQNLLNEINPNSISQSTGVVVFHRGGGLTVADKQFVRSQLNNVQRHQGQFGVTQLQDVYNTDASLASSFVSKDGTTEIALVGFPHNEASKATGSAVQRLQTVFVHPPVGLKVYITGEAPLQQDNIHILQQGIQKMGRITVVFVLVILAVMFRSIMAPILTLFAVGLSFLIASGIVAWLAVRGMPVSSFTQTFLIAVLFGAGTDYSIILLSRFKEELARYNGDKVSALAYTLKGATKTILFSASTVVVAFSVLYFARFGLYRSAVGVGIGVIILVLACVTLVPSFMTVFGPALYWPLSAKPTKAHRPAFLWSRTSRFAVRYPWWTIFAVFLILVPMALQFTDKRTFNPTDDLPNTPSVQGFHTVSQAFGPGYVIPMQIVLHTSANLRTPEGLTAIEHMSRAMANLSPVAQVASATRPTGSIIPQFQIAHQNQLAAKGLSQVQDNLGQLQTHLSASPLSESTMSALQTLQTVSSALQQTGQGSKQLIKSLNQSVNTASQMASTTNALFQSGQQLNQTTTALVNALATWAKQNPGTSTNPAWNQIVQLAKSQQQEAIRAAGLGRQVQQNAGQIIGTLSSLTKGSNRLDTNLRQAAYATARLVQTGGIQTLYLQLNQLQPSLNRAASGVGQLQSGVGDIRDYLVASSAAFQHGDPGFYIPPSALSSNAELRRSMNAYISPDGHVAKFNVVLKTNPYSSAAIQDVPLIQSAAKVVLLTSPVHDGNIYAVGATPLQAELNRISNADFVRTMILVVSSIFLLLVFMLRSIVTPLYIVLSLLGTYFATMGILQAFTIHVLQKPGVTWPVPFFVFLLLVALGVDYSIFLMARVYEDMPQGVRPKEAIRTAMGRMGRVIFPAAIIMAGTFGSMSVAGVASLNEIAMAVVIGLTLYLILMLGFFVPACASVLGAGHSWSYAVPRGSVNDNQS